MTGISTAERFDPHDARRHWAFFRSVNDRMVELGFPIEDETEPLWLVCECPELDCSKTMLMTRPEYEALRAEEELYAVVLGHEDRRLAEIVGRADSYVLVRPFAVRAAA